VTPYLSVRNQKTRKHAYTEIRLEQNELTQTVFLRVTDYSDIDDEEEVHELWDNIIHDLKEIVGG